MTRLRSIAAHDIAGEKTTPRRLTSDRLQKVMSRILKKNKLCAIATVAGDGRAHVNTAYFAYSAALELYFLSHPDSLHCRNLQKRATMAIAVFDSGQVWGERDRGLQLFGTCHEARGAMARQAERAYSKRFKPYAAWKTELDPDDLAREYRLYRFVTRRLKVFDEREFGGAMFVTATVGRDHPR